MQLNNDHVHPHLPCGRSFLRGTIGVRSVSGWGLSYHSEIGFSFQEGDREPGKQQPEMLPMDFGPLLHISSQGIMQRSFLLHQKTQPCGQVLGVYPVGFLLNTECGTEFAVQPWERAQLLWLLSSTTELLPTPAQNLVAKMLPFTGKGRFIETILLQGHKSGSSCIEIFSCPK